MTESVVSKGIDLTARAATLLLAVVYGAGFVIVALHQSRFGISAFDLLKPRIFAAGVSFCLLVSLASLSAFKTFRVGWWSHLPQHAAADVVLDRILQSCVLLLGCELAGTSLPLLFEKPLIITLPIRSALLGLLPSVCAVVIWVSVLFVNRNRRRTFDRLPKIVFAIGTGASGVMMALALYRSQNTPSLWFGLWFFGTGIGSLMLRGTFSTSEARLAANWEQTIPIVFIVLSAYVGVVYPNIRSALGGGASVPVVLYFNEKQLSFAEHVLETNLLDENANGYYVTSPNKTEGAYFIPRDGVALLKFAPKR